MRKACALLLTCLLGTSHAVADYRFGHINSSNGLPHQQVEALAQDGEGNIWIGTRNGLSRYDGYEIKTYLHDDEDTTSLCHNFVNRLFIDSKDRIWACTTDGMCRYRPDTDDFLSFSFPEGQVTMAENSRGDIFCAGAQLSVFNEEEGCFVPYPALESGSIYSLVIDEDDNLYMATSHSILYYDPMMTRLTKLDAHYYSDFLTGLDDIIPMFFDTGGNLWIGRNGNGVIRIDRRTGEKKMFEPSQLSDGTVRVIAEDKLHNIWLGTEKGITVLSPDGTPTILRHDLKDSNTIADNAIYDILCDKEGNIWIGSYFGGLDVLLKSERQFAWSRPGTGVGELKAKVPRMIAETSPNQLWIATEDGGINILDRQSNTFTVFDDIPQIGTNVHSLYFDRQTDEMWIGTFRNGLFRYNIKTKRWRSYDTNDSLPSNSVFDIKRHEDGTLWVATTMGLRRYDSDKDIFTPIGHSVDYFFVYSLCMDNKGNVWAGTAHRGLFCINTATGDVKQWTKQNSGLKDNYITCLYEDLRGIVWIGTNNSGLEYYDPATDEISPVGDDTMLSQGTICSINADHNGQLWIGTSQGLFSLSPETNVTVRYTTGNGLPTNQFNFSSSILTSDNTFFFGMIGGLVSFDASTLTKQQEQLTVHMKHLLINNNVMTAATNGSPLTREFDKTDVIRLSHDQAQLLTIVYGVIMPGNADMIEYQVMLEGIDKEWRNVGGERKFSAYNLPSGTYNLRVRANNSNEGWDGCPERTLKIIVDPPAYLSTAALLAYLIVVCLVALAVYRLFTTRLRERNAVKIANMEKAKIEEMDREKFDFFTTISHELKTPLSLIVAPLRSIRREGLNEESNRHLDTALRNTQRMEELINELVTFNKVETNCFPFYTQYGNPLDFIELIVPPYRAAAVEKGITLTCDTENNGEEVWFSPSYIECIAGNLLSNALKFTPKGGTITVKAHIAEPNGDRAVYLVLEVADTGIGIAPEELGNIFNRYYQTKRGYNVNNSGWGIGLALTKRLAEMHKGNVTVNSTPGQGATFTVKLNVSDDAFDKKCRISDDKIIVPLSQYKLSGKTIETAETTANMKVEKDVANPYMLIVEDNRDMLTYLKDYFSKSYNVLTAENGSDALTMARDNPVDIIVSDIMMPGMNGLEMCATLKGDMATSHIPIILLTAKSGNEDVVAGYGSGAEAYVAKPFDPQILELQVKNIMNLRKTSRKEIARGGDNLEDLPLSKLDKEFIRRINKIVDDNIANSDFSLSTITAEMSISRSLLHTKMKNLMGIPMGDFIRKKRLDVACKMLREGYNVSETAYGTGFSDPNYFSKTFKKALGLNPKEWAMKEKNANT